MPPLTNCGQQIDKIYSFYFKMYNLICNQHANGHTSVWWCCAALSFLLCVRFNYYVIIVMGIWMATIFWHKFDGWTFFRRLRHFFTKIIVVLSIRSFFTRRETKWQKNEEESIWKQNSIIGDWLYAVTTELNLLEHCDEINDVVTVATVSQTHFILQNVTCK